MIEDPAPAAEPATKAAPAADPEPAPEPEPVAEPEPAPEPPKVTVAVHNAGRSVSLAPDTLVWLSATGTKFHSKNNCGTMNPDKARQVTVESAANQGFDACERCY